MRTAPPSRHWRGIAVAAAITTVTVMPGFTLGALTPWIETDLHVSRTAVGLAMSAFYAATAVGSPVTKRLAAHLPVPVVFAVAALIASTTMLVASQGTRFVTLVAALAVGGFSNGLVQPAAGLLIAANVPKRRHSLAAGLVGAALGAATFLPGLLVALVVQPHGWRTAMLIAGLAALVPAAFTPLVRISGIPPSDQAAEERQPANARPALALWALAAALSATGNNAVASYFIQLGTNSGLPVAVTGNLLSASALIAVAVRIAAGTLTDRAPHRNPSVIAMMMLTGALGLTLIAIGSPIAFVLGVVLTFTAGWGWTGLLLATALRLVPGRAEDAGHTVQIGVYTGASIAPFAFGAMSSAVGFAGATLLTAAAALIAAASMIIGTHQLHRTRPLSARGGSALQHDDGRPAEAPPGAEQGRPEVVDLGLPRQSHEQQTGMSGGHPPWKNAGYAAWPSSPYEVRCDEPTGVGTDCAPPVTVASSVWWREP